jgi:hypothetical protein
MSESPLYRHVFMQSMALKMKDQGGVLLSIQETALGALLHLIVNMFMWYHRRTQGAKNRKRWKFLPTPRSLG